MTSSERLSANSAAPAVSVNDVRVTTIEGVEIVAPSSFAIRPGDILGLVGESGCGKTTLAFALLGYAKRGLLVAGGSVAMDCVDLLKLDRRELTRSRGQLVSYVPQDPGTALDPGMRVGWQLQELLRVHQVGKSRSERRCRVRELLAEVLLPTGRDFLRRYPHQLSGGQQQRVLIAAAFACRPRLVVLDEPTTGLDVVTQQHIVQMVRSMCKGRNVAAVWVSHDLAVVRSLADDLAVMYAGSIVESGNMDEVVGNPQHPYTRRLLDAVPDGSATHCLLGIPGHAPAPLERPAGCDFAPRCELAEEACTRAKPSAVVVSDTHVVRCRRSQHVADLCVAEARQILRTSRATSSLGLAADNLSARYDRLQVLNGLDLNVLPGTCLAVVGESGSGKTTLARCLAGLQGEYQGDVRLDGQVLQSQVQRRDLASRQAIQYVFQNPWASLNPRKTVRDIVARPYKVFFPGSKDLSAAVKEMLQRVSLTAAYMNRYPHQLSGGERQRVALARALICGPRYLVCDEVTSSLDVSVQASIIELLRSLLEEEELGLVFITHQLALVRSLATEVAVLANGVIVEHGPAEELFENPRDPYTRILVGTATA